MLGTAERHELALLAAGQPWLPALLLAGRLARPIRKVPKLGWFVADPVVAHSELSALPRALTVAERPYEIVERRYRRKVFIPTYETLRIRLI
ncbi:hypothetical protein [Nocardia sp. CC227C]|uniref:hypothetical protein n=1 Tax=Nocardia sp. CC227C TaxID=3044562 RepID=UPI00278C2E7E|nr:hypothetical protein [Nocardia sp. CC227C]